MPKPVNWQDFESLCKKLWREEWKCQSIKKNGRLGQVQHGVDVYGIPSGSSSYWGIQCKGKDDYSNSQLTIEEIDCEIEKAKKFIPPLEGFIFTTTANKDAKIEEYIRCKNLESKGKGFFSIDIYSWEDIVDLIEPHKTVYEWYLKDILHENNYGISVKFNGNDKEILLKPSFVHYKIQKIKTDEPIFQNSPYKLFQVENIYYARKYDLSYAEINIDFLNIGDTALEYYKLLVYFEDNKVTFKDKNYEVIGIGVVEHDIPNNYSFEDKMLIHDYNDLRPILVPDDGDSIKVYLKLPPERFIFSIKYKFISKDFRCDGEIECKVEPEIEINEIIEKIKDGEESYSENIHPKKYTEKMY